MALAAPRRAQVPEPCVNGNWPTGSWYLSLSRAAGRDERADPAEVFFDPLRRGGISLVPPHNFPGEARPNIGAMFDHGRRTDRQLRA